MKLLLDENLPHELRRELKDHEVFTVAYMDWCGIDNGALLKLAAAEGFDALVTIDRGLQYQQDSSRIPISVVILLAPTNAMESLRPLFPALQRALRPQFPDDFTSLIEPTRT